MIASFPRAGNSGYGRSDGDEDIALDRPRLGDV